ncbi:MAG: hypothetical protein EAZ14_00020, partial [Runella slithyformis]
HKYRTTTPFFLIFFVHSTINPKQIPFGSDRIDLGNLFLFVAPFQVFYFLKHRKLLSAITAFIFSLIYIYWIYFLLVFLFMFHLNY